MKKKENDPRFYGTNILIDKNSKNCTRVKKLSEKELEQIKRFEPGILIEINEFKNSLFTYVKTLPNNSLKNCCEDMLSIWNALPAMLKNNLLADVILGSQKISEKRLLLPGIGGCHVEKGFFTTLILETRGFLHLTEISKLSTEKTILRDLYEKLEKIHELFVPSLNT